MFSTMRRFETVSGLFRQTAADLWRHKLRSFLTMFGIAWGVASLTLMGAVGAGFRRGQREYWKQIGNDIAIVIPGKTVRQAAGQRSGRLVRYFESDLAAIRLQCPSVKIVAGELKRWGTTVSSEFSSGRFLAVGVSPDYLAVRNLAVGRGRQISSADVDNARRVCVLGATVKKQVFGEREDVLGRDVRIQGIPYVAIGLMSEKDQSSTYDGWDHEKVLVPFTSIRRDFPPTPEAQTLGRLDSIIYQPVSVDFWRQARREVTRVLGRLHNFDPEDDGAARVLDYMEIAELFDRVFDASEVFLSMVSLVTLTLGGMGVMNTMMMSVAERTNEVGLKKALGATSRRILTDFFLEGSLLALLSGFAGLLLVWIFISLVNLLPRTAFFSGLPVDWKNLLAVIAALGMVAVLSALPPAWRAANLTPVEALREER